MTKWLAILALVAGLGLVDGASAVLASDRASVPSTYGDAMRWYRKSAEKGDPAAQFYWGLILERGIQGARPNPVAAQAWYRKAAKQGNGLAAFKLGQMAHLGLVGPVDAADARRWYEQAVGRGVAAAAYNLALLLESDAGGPAMPKRALALYARAARDGVAMAALNRGRMLAQHPGVPRNFEAAFMWVVIAEGLGAEVDPAVKKAFASQLSAADIADASVRANAWLAARGAK